MDGRGTRWAPQDYQLFGVCRASVQILLASTRVVRYDGLLARIVGGEGIFLMINRKWIGIALAGASVLGLSGFAGAVQLVTNGGFETVATGGANSSGTGYWVFNAGNTSITSWTIGPVSVDIVNSTYPVYAGTYALDLVGSPGPGEISQTLATSTGLTHTVNFKARYTGAAINRTINVTLGASTQTVTLLAGSSSSWEDVTVSFASVVGSSNTFKLASDPLNTANGNTFIDDVTVTPVPEPFTMALAGCALAAAVRRRRSA